MPRIDFKIIRQRQQSLVETRVELRRVLTGVARQVRPPHGADKQGVAREDEPGIGAALEVSHQQADAVG